METSPDLAVAVAIGIALADFRDLAEKVHVHVLQVSHINGLWKASVKVIVEPRPKAEAEEKPKDEKLEKPELRKNHPDHEEEEESKEFSTPHTEPAPPAPDIHVHVPFERENAHPLYADLQDQHPDYYFHFLNSPSLWDVSQKLYPDIDLYEATHPEPPLIALATAEPDPFYGPALDQPRPTLVKKPKKKGPLYELTLDPWEES